jgi:hypothetical protein
MLGVAYEGTHVCPYSPSCLEGLFPATGLSIKLILGNSRIRGWVYSSIEKGALICSSSIRRTRRRYPEQENQRPNPRATPRKRNRLESSQNLAPCPQIGSATSCVYSSSQPNRGERVASIHRAAERASICRNVEMLRHEKSTGAPYFRSVTARW